MKKYIISFTLFCFASLSLSLSAVQAEDASSEKTIEVSKESKRDVIVRPAPTRTYPKSSGRDVVVRSAKDIQKTSKDSTSVVTVPPKKATEATRKPASQPTAKKVISKNEEPEEVLVAKRVEPSEKTAVKVISQQATSQKVSPGLSSEPKTPFLATGVAQAEENDEPEQTVPAQSASKPTPKPAAAAVMGPGVGSAKVASDDAIAITGTQQRPVVADIEVRGNHIISSGTILNKIRIRRGDPLLQETINDDIKRLYTSGFFQDIKVDVVKESPSQYKLVFVVDEKPVVRQIIIEGNESIGESKLRKEIHLIEGQILDPKAVKEGVVGIRELYQDKGFKFVEVKSETDVNEYTKEAILYILIDEGKKYQISQVDFEGNKAFSSRKLRSVMRTKARNLLFLRTGVFHEEHFENDLEKIRSAYIRAGYADVRLEPRFDYDKETKKMKIIISVDEGQVYQAGDIQIQGNVLFPESEIWEVLSMLPGDVYSQIALNDDLQAIQRFYFYQGYIAAQIDPEVRFNRETGKVDITFNIYEGDLYFINKVKIRGNTKTKDMVIRRELRIRPGEKFDGSKVDRSKDRLNSLGYFEEVSFETEEPEDPSAPNVRDIIFKVKERQTGQMSFGGGISSVETLIGFAEISQSNFDLFNWPTFTGGGQRIFIKGQLGTITRDIDFGFTEPYLFGMPYSYDLRVYDTYLKAENVDWNEDRLGASNVFGHAFTDHISASIGIKAERVELKDVEADASPEILENGATNNLFSTHTTLVHDTRNNRMNPTRGHYASVTPELVMGDSNYWTLMFDFSKYWPLFRTHLLEARVRLGVSDKLGSTVSVPVFDRFFAGGIGTVRGYGYRRVGPKGDNGDPIGGESMAIMNFDYTFPIIRNFKGIVFMDVANVGKDTYDVVSGDFVLTIGPGVKVNTPIGPMAFYYGYPIANADPDNSNGRFEFSIAKAF